MRARAMAMTARASGPRRRGQSRVTSQAASAKRAARPRPAVRRAFVPCLASEYQSVEPATAPTEAREALRRGGLRVRCRRRSSARSGQASEATSKPSTPTMVSAACRTSSWYAPPIAWLAAEERRMGRQGGKQAQRQARPEPSEGSRGSFLGGVKGRPWERVVLTLPPLATSPPAGYWSSERKTNSS